MEQGQSLKIYVRTWIYISLIFFLSIEAYTSAFRSDISHVEERDGEEARAAETMEHGVSNIFVKRRIYAPLARSKMRAPYLSRTRTASRSASALCIK